MDKNTEKLSKQLLLSNIYEELNSIYSLSGDSACYATIFL